MNILGHRFKWVLVMCYISCTACSESLTDDEIEDQELAMIESYVLQNQLQGEFISSNIFVSIQDTGQQSLQIDTLIQFDSVFVDTFFLDTTIVDSSIIIDTVLVDTQLAEIAVLDSIYFFDNPTNNDTVLIAFSISDLDDRLVFSTNEEIFQRSSGFYPTLSQLISGLRRSLVLFSEGGSGIALIPSDEAYGRVGNNESLPPNTPIRVDFELVEFRTP